MARRSLVLLLVVAGLLTGCGSSIDSGSSDAPVGEIATYERAISLFSPTAGGNLDAEVAGAIIVDFLRAHPDEVTEDGRSGPEILELVSLAWERVGRHPDECSCGHREGTDADVALLVLYPDSEQASAARVRLEYFVATINRNTEGPPAYTGAADFARQYAERNWQGPRGLENEAVYSSGGDLSGLLDLIEQFRSGDQ